MTGKVYPEGDAWIALASEYVSEFKDLDELEERWRDFKELHPALSVFTESVKELMSATFCELVDVYERYQNLPSETQEQKEELATINSYLPNMVFNYDKTGAGHQTHQGVISGFFRKKMDDLNIHTCYYCDMAYINPYIVDDDEMKSQFDLDHALAKDDCPLVALSLHNFVPSCPVCNERLKRKNPLSDSLDGLKLVAPCSEDFDANKQIHFKVNQEKVCTSGFMRHKDCYRMIINAHGVYASYAKLFRLEERYEYHKGEALRLLDLKRKYPMSNIRQIARLMHKTADEVKEDIFGLHFSKNNHRCFDKMKRDIM
jgi:hypothetical protein